MKYLSVAIFVIFYISGFTQPNSDHHPKPVYVGILTEEFDEVMTAQNNTYWCWAASAQMVLNYYDIYIAQEEVVKKILGTDQNGDLPNQAVKLEDIHKCLNYTGIDSTGQQYKVTATLGNGPPAPAMLIQQLSKKKPVIVGYHTPSGGHIVVITAVSFVETDRGPKIMTIVVRDPMPDQTFSMNNGKVEYPGKTFARRMNAYWFIDVEKINKKTSVKNNFNKNYH